MSCGGIGGGGQGGASEGGSEDGEVGEGGGDRENEETATVGLVGKKWQRTAKNQDGWRRNKLAYCLSVTAICDP